MENNILVVGGTFSREPNENGTYGKCSSLVDKIVERIASTTKDIVNVFNGGDYNNLNNILSSVSKYDIVFWLPNIEDNSLDKIRNVKEIAPKVMLITSKRNDNNKYSFQELIQQSLSQKANMTIEFSKVKDIFNIRVFDPLGCVWFDGTDINLAMDSLLNRLYFIKSITRKSSYKSNDDKNLVMKWYFDQFKQDMFRSEEQVDVPNEQMFINIVQKYAKDFHNIMGGAKRCKRFVGNCSMKQPPQVGRCMHGMPSFKSGEYVFISKRNIDKETIDLDSFVPCFLDGEDVYYCGDNKPSVDTPIQLRLYKLLPQINYMIHSHCYINGAPFTNISIPWVAIEEVDEVMNLIENINSELDAMSYCINLIGHGSIVLSNSIEGLCGIEYIRRDLPEIMY